MATLEERKKMKHLEKEEKKRAKEQEEADRQFDSDLEKHSDAVTKNDITSILKGKGALSTANLKKILSVITSRTVVQYVIMILCALLFIMVILGGTIVGGLLVYSSATNNGLPPIVGYIIYPQIFFAACVGLAGAAAGSREIDVIVGAGAASLIAYVCYFIVAIFFLNSAEKLVFSSCPSMGDPGQTLVTFAAAYKYGNFSFNPLNPLNPAGVAGYLQPSDFTNYLYYTIAEVICATGNYPMFFWWLNLVNMIFGFIVICGLGLDLWNRHKMLSTLTSVISSKYNAHDKHGVPYIHINGVADEDRP